MQCHAHAGADYLFRSSLPVLCFILPILPQGNLHIVDYSNSPFARPDIRILIEGALLQLCLDVLFYPTLLHPSSIASMESPLWPCLTCRRCGRHPVHPGE